MRELTRISIEVFCFCKKTKKNLDRRLWLGYYDDWMIRTYRQPNAFMIIVYTDREGVCFYVGEKATICTGTCYY